MKKIVLACDGKNFSRGAIEFAKSLQQAEPFLLVGSFLHSFNYARFIPTAFSPDAVAWIAMSTEEQEEVEGSISKFKQCCRRDGIEYRVHEEGLSWSIGDLIKESRFSDLMIISEELFYTNMNNNQPNEVFKQVIHKSECPVIVVPENYKAFNKIIVAYDGKKESVFALKQFCNLFPQLTGLETEIIYIKDEESLEIPDLAYLEEYAGRHFANLNFKKIHFSARNHFSSWMEGKTDVLLIAGSFGRNTLSSVLNKSFVEGVIHDHTSPVFIAHNN